MVGGIGSGYRSSGGHRVFVLIDNDSAKGVFFSWDAAEDFADQYGYSLENLMEYETPSDHPDHLHLMAAKWDSEWIFQGEWSNKVAKWQTPPRQIRLDHYHARGDEFHLFRSREFDWTPGLLAKINPMAPDKAFDVTAAKPTRSIPEPPPDRPEEEAPPEPPEDEETPYFPDYKTADNRDKHTGSTSEKPKKSYFQDYETDFESNEPEISFDDSDAMMSDKIDTSPSFPSPVRKLPKIVEQADKLQDIFGTKGLPDREESNQDDNEDPEQPNEPLLKSKPRLRLTPLPVPVEEKTEKATPITPEKSRIIKKSSLKLRQKTAPEPIPAFKPTSTHGALLDNRLSSESTPSQEDASGKDGTSSKPRKVWSPKLIGTVVAMVVSWIAGILWAVIPEPSAASIVAEVATLNRARMVIVEPQMLWYQFDVEPVHQERFIQNLNLQPIPKTEPVPFPTYHTMDTWAKPEVYIRPPYAQIEVEEWWIIKQRIIQHGFYRKWEDGSILILDFESDTILGWAQAKHLKDILN